MKLKDNKNLSTVNKELLFDNKIVLEIPLLDKRVLAQLLNISIKTIDKFVCAKEIPFIKIGKSVRFYKREIEKWLEERSYNGYRRETNH